MRTIVDIPDRDVHELDALCGREHMSRAEAIRRAVGDYLKRHLRAEEDAAFGLWKDRKQEALSCQNALRDEWESRTVHEPPAS